MCSIVHKWSKRKLWGCTPELNTLAIVPFMWNMSEDVWSLCGGGICALESHDLVGVVLNWSVNVSMHLTVFEDILHLDVGKTCECDLRPVWKSWVDLLKIWIYRRRGKQMYKYCSLCQVKSYSHLDLKFSFGQTDDELCWCVTDWWSLEWNLRCQVSLYYISASQCFCV